jgi:hemerythrin
VADCADNFSHEEALMKEAGYPGLEVHKKKHELFIRRVTGQVNRFDAGEDIMQELLKILNDWERHHIKVEDASYAKYIWKQ